MKTGTLYATVAMLPQEVPMRLGYGTCIDLITQEVDSAALECSPKHRYAIVFVLVKF